ncbi:MAG: hypothetical protein OEZ02_11795 [Anaerolineae bacterium]|nr:hypothetical protein [Anaerolineae bacterium]
MNKYSKTRWNTFLLLLSLFLSGCRAIGSGGLAAQSTLPPITPGFNTPTPAPTKSLAFTPTELSTSTPESAECGTSFPIIQPTRSAPPPISGNEELPDGFIYAWYFGGPQSSYYKLDLGKSWRNNISRVGEDSIIGPFPTRASALAFSRYSQQIAYIMHTDRQEVWLADVQLNQIICLWVDQAEWLGEITLDEHVEIMWGPQDKSLIIHSLIDTPRALAIDLSSGQVHKISGFCDQIARSPVTGKMGIWCLEKESEATIALTGDGSIKVFSSAPDVDFTPVSDWVYSPSGDRLLYANEQNEILVISDEGKTLILPIAYDPPECCGITGPKRELQWSQDGNFLLVYGTNNINGTLTWHIVDSQSGEIIWTEDIISIMHALDIKTDHEDIGICVICGGQDAVISPNGKWFVSSYFVAGYRFSVLTSTTTGKSYQIGEGLLIYFSWVD